MSVPTNIVEGSGQRSSRQYSNFLRIAINSANELEYHVIAGHDSKVIRASDHAMLLSQIIEVRKIIHGLIRSLATRSDNRTGA